MNKVPAVRTKGDLSSHNGVTPKAICAWAFLDSSSSLLNKGSKFILEKAMAPYSSTLAWKIPRMEESGRLQSMGCKEPDTTEWLHFHFSLSCIGEGNWQPTPVFFPGESQGRGSLVGCCLWGRTESDTTEQLSNSSSKFILIAMFLHCITCLYLLPR